MIHHCSTREAGSSNHAASTLTTPNTAMPIPRKTPASPFAVTQDDLPRTPDAQLAVVRSIYPTLSDKSNLDELHSFALRSLYLINDFERELGHCRDAMASPIDSPLPVEELQRHYANVWSLRQEASHYLSTIEAYGQRARSHQSSVWTARYPPDILGPTSRCSLDAMRPRPARDYRGEAERGQAGPGEAGWASRRHFVR
jgi:hypothetical protein